MFIQQLSPHVADLIAAGEVVERPASVVKELVENAIDALSSAVVVEIQSGGMASIRVTDNGCGIARDELPTAFLRHATSKLRAADDLAAIGTLGFRGEALAAIAAVSRVEIFSRHKDAAIGASLSLEGGVPGIVDLGTVVEALAMKSKELVTPEFYEVQLKGRDARDDESAAMLDIIYASRCFDLGVCYNWGGIAYKYYEMSIDNISSRFDAVIGNAELAIQDTLDDLDDYDPVLN